MNAKHIIFLCFAVCLSSVYSLAKDSTVIFEKTPHGGIQPQAIVDASGTVHLLYYKGQPREGDLFYVSRAKGQRGFTAPLKVNSIASSACCVGSIFRARMAVGQGGIAHVLWHGSFGFVKKQWEKKGKERSPEEFVFLFYTRLAQDKKSFEPQRNLNSKTYGLDGNGAVTADRNGAVNVFWHAKIKGQSKRMPFTVRSTNNGKSFSAESPIVNKPLGVCECCTLEAFSSSSGRLYVAYRTAGLISRNVVIFSSDGRSGKFNELHRHHWNILACPASTFAFAEDDRRVFAAWENEGHVHLKDVLSATPSVNVSKASKSGKYPSLALNAKGDRLVTWSAETGWGKGGYVQYQVTNRNGAVSSQGKSPKYFPAAYSFSSACALPSGEFLVFY
ncbi:MAG: sialidase family protein [Opitutales bacterium]